MRFIKKITVGYDNIDIEYAEKIKNAIDHFSELCADDDLRCEKTCPFYPFCGKSSNDIILMFSEYIENHVE